METGAEGTGLKDARPSSPNISPPCGDTRAHIPLHFLFLRPTSMFSVASVMHGTRGTALKAGGPYRRSAER